MGKAKGRTRQERGLKQIEGQPVHLETPGTVADEDLRPIEFSVLPLELDGDNQVVQRLELTIRNDLVDFAVVQQARDAEGRWRDVVRVDCCHGMVHVHRFTESGKEEKRDICPNDRMDDGYQRALEIVWDDAEENLRRWRDGG